MDFIAKFNHQIIIAEAKFLTDFGGHQNAQFNDAITTMKMVLNRTNYPVKAIAILDGVLYIQGRNKMFENLQHYTDDEVVISAILLRDYLYSL